MLAAGLLPVLLSSDDPTTAAHVAKALGITRIQGGLTPEAEVAARAGLPAKTIRYYDEIGLIHPDRDDNGYRRFGTSDLHILTFLARARSLGFSIDECCTLLALYQDRARASADVKAMASRHLARIASKIAERQAMRAILSDLVTHCAGDQRPDCPILKDLAHKP